MTRPQSKQIIFVMNRLHRLLGDIPALDVRYASAIALLNPSIIPLLGIARPNIEQLPTACEAAQAHLPYLKEQVGNLLDRFDARERAFLAKRLLSAHMIDELEHRYHPDHPDSNWSGGIAC